jgi:hypothetical protein
MSRRFGFPQIEHAGRATIEPFSANCVDSCGKPGIDDNLKAACDYGSIKYCSTANNIIKPDCLAHADRVVRTYVAEKTGIAYSNKLASSINTSDAYNALGAPISEYVINNRTTLDSNEIKSILAITDLEKTLTDSDKKLYFAPAMSMFKTCGAVPTLNCSASWLEPKISELINMLLIQNKSKALKDIIVSIYDPTTPPNIATTIRFQHLFGSYFDLIISKLTINDLLTNTIIWPMRNDLPLFKTKLDTYIADLVMKSSFNNKENLTDPYTADFSNNKNLYSADIQKLITIITSVAAPTDSLLVAFKAADTKNIARLTTVDPTLDPIAVAMLATGKSDLVNGVKSKILTYCIDPTNLSKSTCTPYASQAISSDPTTYYRNAIASALKPDGTLDASILDKVVGLKDWLAINTKDVVAADGVISSTCGTGVLTRMQCSNLCKIYPELCSGDQSKRCINPLYRYTQTEGFKGDSAGAYTLYAFIIFIAFILFIGISVKYGDKIKNSIRKTTGLSLCASKQEMYKLNKKNNP